jgi:lysophospholipase L1-like esterase
VQVTLAVALLAPAVEVRAELVRVASLALPAGVRPTSMALDDVHRLLLVGTRNATAAPELYAIDLGSDPAKPAIAWTLELGAKVHAIVHDGARALVATGDDAAELVVVDVTSGERVGAFDAEGAADGLSVKLVEPGVARLGRRLGDAPEAYRLDVEDPAGIVVLGATDRSRSLRMRPVAPLAGYAHGGRLVGRGKLAGGALLYLVTTEQGAEVQVVASSPPVAFADANGDGVYRLGCVGDSNTSAIHGPRWCELLEDAIGVAAFEIVNVAQVGATVTPAVRSGPDAAAQMATVLTFEPDAVVLAFGTNDRMLGRSPVEIHDAYVVEAARAAEAGVAFFVATTPPLGGCVGEACPRIFELNALLRATFGSAVLEFFTGFTGEHMHPDRIHVNAAGQALRAERALAVLAPGD